MRFQKGQGGRKPGAVNKVSKAIREALGQFVVNNLEGLQTTYDSLKPAEKLKFMADIMPYVTPKLQNTEHSGEVDGNFTVTWDKPWLKNELPPSGDESSAGDGEGN